MFQNTRIAIVGFGLVGRRHAEVVRRAPDLSLAAIVEPSQNGRAEAERLGVPVFSTLEQMLDITKPDGVVLATPTPMHLEQGLTCIAAKCPVLIEKPITVTSQEALQLTTAAEKAEVPLLVGHHRRHNGMVKGTA